MPLGLWMRGVVLGMLTALLAIGLALVYRANRIVNFAQADLGFVPGRSRSASSCSGAGRRGSASSSACVGAVVLGGRRRGRLRPSLPSLVAAGAHGRDDRDHATARRAGIVMPRLWGRARRVAADPATVRLDGRRSATFVLNANDLLAAGRRPAWRWRPSPSSSTAPGPGSAIRATAERSDRAAMLGIPVSRLATLAGSSPPLLSFIALFLRAGILGVPWGTAIGPPRSCPPSPRSAIGSSAPAVDRGHRDRPRRARVRRPLERDDPLLVRRSWRGRVRRAAAATPQAPGRRRRRPRRGGRRGDPAAPRRGRRASSWFERSGWPLARRRCRLCCFPTVLRVDQVIKATASSPSRCRRLARGADRMGRPDLARPGRVLRDRRRRRRDVHARWHVDLTLALLVGGLAGAIAALVGRAAGVAPAGPVPRRHDARLRRHRDAWLLNDRFFDWVPSDRDRTTSAVRPDQRRRPARYYFYSLAVLAIGSPS